jgi:hypothetical protein
MPKVRIYQVKTETPSTKDGHTFDRFNVSGATCEEAMEKAKKRLAKFPSSKERVQDITLIASVS